MVELDVGLTMTRFIFKLALLPVLASVTGMSSIVHADNAGAPRTVSARVSTTDLSREFAVVPAGDVMYTHLNTVRSAGWSTLTGAAPATMTRYEMALEVAKALITVRARQRADARGATTAPAPAFHALRALCSGLQAELARFDIDSRSTTIELEKMIELSSAPSIPPANSTRTSPSRNSSSINIPASIETANVPSLQGMARGDANREATLEIPLSQRLRVFGAVSSLARSANDPLQNNRSTATGSLRLGGNSRASFGSAGASLALTDWLRMRGQASRRSTSRSLGRTLGGQVFENSATPAGGNERSIGGGVDLTLSPGVVLSGDVAHFKTEGGLLPGLASFTGTRYAGGLELSGWQNRVALSANLSRLVPEDSLALSVTAAQLNLGVGLTQQISLKLLYQQLFETPQQARSNRVFAGGININF